MSAKGFYLSDEGHVVNVIPPIDITGGKTGQAFSMANYAHASIVVQVGVSAAAFTKIVINACTDSSGSNPTAIAYDLFKQETAGASHDVLSARTSQTTAGYTPSANDNIFYVIELDAAQLPSGSPYVQVQLTNTTNSVIASAVAFLSGSRYPSEASATVCA